MKYLAASLFTFLAFSIFSQDSYQEGFIIDAEGNEIQCMINVTDWKSNPSTFTYKTDETATVQTGDFTTIQEFGVGKNVRFVQATVDIDQSSDDYEFFSTSMNPEWQSQTVFLKVVIDGKYDLYEYNDNSLTRYFYRADEEKIEQLVYKKYAVSSKRFRENTQFRQQLNNGLAELQLDPKLYGSTIYKKNSLAKLIKVANSEANASYQLYKVKRDLIKLNLKAKAGRGNVNYENVFGYDALLEDVNLLGAGIELEFVIQQGNNNLSIFAEPSFRNSAEVSQEFTDEELLHPVYRAELRHKLIQLPVGLKYKIPVAKRVKLFTCAFGLIESDREESLIVYRPTGERIVGDFYSPNNFGLGAGVELFNLFTLEGRYLGNLSQLAGLGTESYTIPHWSINAGINLLRFRN